MLMGATLPVLAKYIIREQQALARRIGLLYGINTLGAAAGCATVGLLLIGTLGVLQSAVVGSAIYLMIAFMAGALTLSARLKRDSTKGFEETWKQPARPVASAPPGSSREVVALVVV